MFERTFHSVTDIVYEYAGCANWVHYAQLPS
ncbi:MAG: hypothetical protein XXXNARYT_003794 [Candidatus Accumulibacter regalis]|jgi:hypothetical protein